MRSAPWLLAVLLLMLGGVLSIACGGGDDSAVLDVREVVTATPPETLPEPLIVGEQLPEVEGAIYIVRAGDTLFSIAGQFSTTVEAIVDANDIADARQLEVGQQLLIPGGQESVVLDITPEPSPTEGTVATAEPSATPAPPPTLEPPGGSCIYTVVSGDIAARIAQDHGIEVEELAALNNTTVDDLRSLQVGDELVVPCTEPEPAPSPTLVPFGESCIYTVESGDIAIEIAERHGIELEELAALNGTTVDDLRSLQVGDELVVPCPEP